jgi:hypothetical protein
MISQSKQELLCGLCPSDCASLYSHAGRFGCGAFEVVLELKESKPARCAQCTNQHAHDHKPLDI